MSGIKPHGGWCYREIIHAGNGMIRPTWSRITVGTAKLIIFQQQHIPVCYIPLRYDSDLSTIINCQLLCPANFPFVGNLQTYCYKALTLETPSLKVKHGTFKFLRRSCYDRNDKPGIYVTAGTRSFVSMWCERRWDVLSKVNALVRFNCS